MQIAALAHEAKAVVRGVLGQRGRYGIRAGYRHRETAPHFDDTANTDRHQREVYEFAADLMRREGLGSVCDVGCGSGYKLVHMLGAFETVGTEVPETVDYLRRTYPDRRWLSADFADRTMGPFDLVVCADVIEHVPDPDALLGFLEHLARGPIIVSTPARDVMYPPDDYDRYGPPRNPWHIREWTMAELRRYLSGRFEVLEHRITNRAQSTQMAVVNSKGSRRPGTSDSSARLPRTRS